jgi:hypothetical protein
LSTSGEELHQLLSESDVSAGLKPPVQTVAKQASLFKYTDYFSGSSGFANSRQEVDYGVLLAELFSGFSNGILAANQTRFFLEVNSHPVSGN